MHTARQISLGITLLLATIGLSSCKTTPWKLEIALHTLAIGDITELRGLYNQEIVTDEKFSFSLSDDSLGELTYTANRTFLTANLPGSLEIYGIFEGKKVGEIKITIKESNTQIMLDYLSTFEDNQIEVRIINRPEQHFFISSVDEEIIIDFKNSFEEEDIKYECDLHWNLSRGEGYTRYDFVSPIEYSCQVYFMAFIDQELDYSLDYIDELSGSSEELFDLVHSYSQGDVEIVATYYHNYLMALKK